MPDVSPRIPKEEQQSQRKAINKNCTYRSIASLEQVQPLLGLGPLVVRDNTLQHGLCDLPELIMLVLEQQNDSVALTVEGGRDMEKGFGDDFLDLLVVDGGLLLERVNGSTALDDVEELFGRHGSCCCMERRSRD